MGENGTWGKHTNFEQGTRSPLVMRVPGQANPGVATNALVEFVDVYPTLAEACGLPIPAHCEGTSLMPVPSHCTIVLSIYRFVGITNGSRYEHEMYLLAFSAPAPTNRSVLRS